jgi:hypothetical protein
VTCAFVADGACPVASLKAKQGSSMTHGDANENDDVLACASTDAFAEHGANPRSPARCVGASVFEKPWTSSNPDEIGPISDKCNAALVYSKLLTFNKTTAP